MPSIDEMVSGGSSRGAKIKTFGLVDIGSPCAAEFITLIKLDAALLERLFPAHRLLAEEGIELFRRAAYRIDPGFLKLLGDQRIGIDFHHLILNLVDDRARRAGRRHK